MNMRIPQDLHDLVAGVQIIIATPGRFNDLVERSVISLRSVTYLVLDEADR
jgi:superfamily II DNA/RNA helicase